MKVTGLATLAFLNSPSQSLFLHNPLKTPLPRIHPGQYSIINPPIQQKHLSYQKSTLNMSKDEIQNPLSEDRFDRSINHPFLTPEVYKEQSKIYKESQINCNMKIQFPIINPNQLKPEKEIFIAQHDPYSFFLVYAYDPDSQQEEPHILFYREQKSSDKFPEIKDWISQFILPMEAMPWLLKTIFINYQWDKTEEYKEERQEFRSFNGFGGYDIFNELSCRSRMEYPTHHMILKNNRSPVGSQGYSYVNYTADEMMNDIRKILKGAYVKYGPKEAVEIFVEQDQRRVEKMTFEKKRKRVSAIEKMINDPRYFEFTDFIEKSEIEIKEFRKLEEKMKAENHPLLRDDYDKD